MRTVVSGSHGSGTSTPIVDFIPAHPGMSQPNIAAIETGRRATSDDVLERLLRAADYRPSLALEKFHFRKREEAASVAA